ncbi:hypothetical protein SAMN05216357_101305 [Porphyromonadaceae bacterium KH3CP3RA]|nr:hypothetical protein SAMN05216357_101305 [Porphyromonadaceae bacterium KH3CP3RA]
MNNSLNYHETLKGNLFDKYNFVKNVSYFLKIFSITFPLANSSISLSR